MNIRKLRIIDEVIFHCSASPHNYHDDINVIEEWHKERFNPTPDGTYCGYHIYIKRDGTRQYGRAFHWYGQHCKHKNWTTIGVCFGGMGGEDITQEQLREAESLLIELRESQDLNIKKANQHSRYDKKKSECCNLSIDQINYMKQLIGDGE